MRPIQPCFDPQQLEFEGNVYDQLEELLQVTRSDAQGIHEASDIDLGELYNAGFTALEAAQAIDKATRIEPLK